MKIIKIGENRYRCYLENKLLATISLCNYLYCTYNFTIHKNKFKSFKVGYLHNKSVEDFIYDNLKNIIN